MKYIASIIFAIFMTAGLMAQTKPKSKPPAQSEMDKALEQAMKAEGLTEAEKVEMREMMKGVQPAMNKKPGSDLASFTDNRKLIPAKDISRINSISKKAYSDADVQNTVSQMYGKLMAKIPADEKAIIQRVQTKVKDGASLMSASIISFMQGHSQAAMGLSMKAVMAQPDNVYYQNNMAAILSQSGYPEKAIPFLNKLSGSFPENSTVMHNLGYAWLRLGLVDSAKKYFGGAAIRNPGNPETKLCNGVIAELNGDPKKAADNYVESFEEAPNPFTENLVKNVKAQDRLSNIDYEKLKSRIVIYEYFKKDWIKVPALSGSVKGFENDMRIKNGYVRMSENFRARIELLIEASEAEMDALMKKDKGEDAFAKKMMEESIKGVSMMSLPAVYVQKILLGHIKTWAQQYGKENAELTEKVNALREESNKGSMDDKCADFDMRNNLFLSSSNRLIREFHERKNEEFRVWLNAFCTWSWYVVGNPKNSVMAQCINWTEFLADLYFSSVEDQQALAACGVEQDSYGVATITEPVIPNFSCPVLVNIPIGLDEIQISADAINFDKNTWNIDHAVGAKTPNATLSFGVGKTEISEAGKGGTPYVKTGNESVTTSGFNKTNDNNLAADPNVSSKNDSTKTARLDDLMPLSKIVEKSDANKMARAALTRKLLEDMLSTNCFGDIPIKKRKGKFEVGFGKLEFWPITDPKTGETLTWNEEAGDYQFEDGRLLNSKFTVELGQLEIEDVETNGPQVTVTNGLGLFERGVNFIKSLFD